MTLDRVGLLRGLLVLWLVTAATIMMIVASVPLHASTLTFGSNANLSSDPSSSGNMRTAASSSNVYVAWLNNTAGNSNILFRTSNNNGSSFGPVIRINNSTNQNSANEQIAATGSDVYIVWEQNVTLTSSHIFLRASTNSGASFGAVADLSAGVTCGGGCTLSTSTVPELAAMGNNVYIVWLGGTTKGTDIFFRASTNNGASFAAALPSFTTTAFGSTQPQIAAVTNYVYVTWSDLGSVGRAQTYFTASSNSGTSFAYVAPHSLSSTLSGETDLYQEIVASGTSVYVAWTNDTINTDNTMFVASTNNGANFASAFNLNKGLVTDLNPELAASGNNVYVVWGDTTSAGTQVLYRLSSNNGAGFGSIVNLSNTPSASNGQTIAASGTNVHIAWVETAIAGTDIYFVSSSDSGSTFGSPLNLSRDGGSVGPTVGASGNYAYVAWEDDTTGNGDAYFARGAPLVVSAPVALPKFALVFMNRSVTILLWGNDPQAFPLLFSIVSGPTQGALGPITSTGPSSAVVTYTPNANYYGPDSFTFKVNNGVLDSPSATILIRVVMGTSLGNGGKPPPRA